VDMMKRLHLSRPYDDVDPGYTAYDSRSRRRLQPIPPMDFLVRLKSAQLYKAAIITIR